MPPQQPHHPISAAGKTATNRRRFRFNPYGRPPPQAPPSPPPPKIPSWIFSGAAKIISSVFISDSSSDSSSSDEEEFISDDNVNCGNGHDGLPNGTNGSNLDSGNLLQGCTSKKLGAGVEETGRKHVIKQLLLQETFSREECDQLVKLINSRVVEHSTVDRGTMVDSALTPGSRVLNVTPDHAVMEARKFLEEKKAGQSLQSDFGHGSSGLYSTVIQHIESEAGSPADMAKSYMRARPPWASPSTEYFELRTPSSVLTRLASEEELPSASHLKERSYLSSGAWSMQDEIRKVRSKATEDMLLSLSSSKDTNFSSRNGSRYVELKHLGLSQHSETQKANEVPPSSASLSIGGLIGETQIHTIEDNAAHDIDVYVENGSHNTHEELSQEQSETEGNHALAGNSNGIKDNAAHETVTVEIGSQNTREELSQEQSEAEGKHALVGNSNGIEDNAAHDTVNVEIGSQNTREELSQEQSEAEGKHALVGNSNVIEDNAAHDTVNVEIGSQNTREELSQEQSEAEGKHALVGNSNGIEDNAAHDTVNVENGSHNTLEELSQEQSEAEGKHAVAVAGNSDGMGTKQQGEKPVRRQPKRQRKG